MRFSDLPLAARLYVALVCGLTLGLLGLVLADVLPGRTGTASLELALLIAIAATVAHSFPVSTPAKQAYHVSLPMFVAAAVVLSPLQLLACIGLVNAVEHVRRRRSAFAQLFNAAAYALSALAAQVVYHLLWTDPRGSVDISQPACLLAGLAGAVAFICVNRGLVSLAIWLGNGIPPREQRMFDAESLLTEGVLLLMGLPLAHLAALAPWAAAVGAAPLWLIHRVLDLPNQRAQRRRDGLTELFSAPYLTETCTRELHRARRFGRSTGLILLDVDGLSELNATYGPQAGDAIIRGTAELIKKAIREYDLAARLAGGMFAVLLPETDLAQAQLVAERVRRSIAERRHEIADSVEQVRVTVSLGVVIGGAHVESADRMFSAAEAALANAKHDGGNQLAFTLLPEAVPSLPTEGTTPEPAATTSTAVHSPASGSVTPRPVLSVSRLSAATLFALALTAGATCAAAWSLLHASNGSTFDWSTLVLLVALAMLAETRSLDFFERSSFSMSAVPLLAACVLLGPAGAALLAPAIALVRRLTRRAPWQRTLIDTSAYLLAGVGAAITYQWLGGPPGLEALPQLIAPAIVAGLVIYLHTLAIAAAMAIDARSAPHRVWLDHFRWLWPQFVALGGLGLLLAVAYHVFGLIGAAAFAVPPIVMRYVTKQYLDRAVDNVRRLRTLNEQLEHRAFHDPLTNLANRALFTERLEHAFHRPGQDAIAVLFIDLDNFKTVNDTLGHAAGDLLLTIATQRLRQCVRWEDTIARLGGDEFTVLLENVRDVSDVARSAERIAEALRQPFDLDGQEGHVSASIGIALDTDRSHAPDDLMREADMAMYRAKQSGKSRYEIFDPGMNTEAMERLDLETDLRQAIDRAELSLAYQPLVQLGTGMLEGYQAHLRWQHPRHGLLEANAFLALADDPALLAALEHWAIARACRDALALERTVCLTLAAWTREVPEIVRTTLATARRASVPLALGCAESVVAGDESQVVEVAFDELQALGVGAYLDGFGSGALSLRQLHRLPIDALAVDPANIEDLRVQRSIVALAQTLELDVLVVRGVPQTLDELLALAPPTAA